MKAKAACCYVRFFVCVSISMYLYVYVCAYAFHLIFHKEMEAGT